MGPHRRARSACRRPNEGKGGDAGERGTWGSGAWPENADTTTQCHRQSPPTTAQWRREDEGERKGSSAVEFTSGGARSGWSSERRWRSLGQNSGQTCRGATGRKRLSGGGTPESSGTGDGNSGGCIGTKEVRHAVMNVHIDFKGGRGNGFTRGATWERVPRRACVQGGGDGCRSAGGVVGGWGPSSRERAGARTREGRR